MSFAENAVPVLFGDVKFDCLSFSQRPPRRLIEHGTPGREGADISDNGRAAVRDTITARMTLDVHKKMRAMADKKKVEIFTHPLLGSYQARASVSSVDGSGAQVDTVTVVVEFVEAVPQPLLQVGTRNASSSKSTADNLFDNLTVDMGDLGDLTDFSAGLDVAWGDFFDDFGAFDDAFSLGAIRDIGRTIDKLASSATNLISEIRTVAEDIGDVASSIIDAPMMIVQSARETVEALQSETEQVLRRTFNTSADLFSSLDHIYGNQKSLESVMDANDILDPLLMLPGTELLLPLPL